MNGTLIGIFVLVGIIALLVWAFTLKPKYGRQGKSAPSRQWSTIYEKFHGRKMPGDESAPIMRQGSSGFTLIELMIVMALLGILAAVISGMFINNRGATERRAYEGAQLFLSNNGLAEKVERLTCAGDSDGDGYGTCTIKLQGENPIRLDCPVKWLDLKMGATSCKEVFSNLNMMNQMSEG